MSDTEDTSPVVEENNPLRPRKTGRSRRRRCLLFTVFTVLLLVFFFFGFIVLLHLEKGIIFIECFTTDYVTKGLKTESIHQEIEQIANKNLTEHEFKEIYDQFAVLFEVKHSHVQEKRQKVAEICRDWLTFLVLTLTTVGYGSQTLRSDGAKIFLAVYASLGIPITLFYIFTLARFIRRTVECFVALCHCRLNRKGTVYYMEIHTFIIIFILLGGYFSLAVVDALYSPEKPTIINAIYFYFITFSTVGYVDILVPRSEHPLYPLGVVGGMILVFAFADATWKLLRKIRDQFCFCKLSCCCLCCCKCCSFNHDDEEREEDKGSSTSLVDANGENGMHMSRFRYDSAEPYVTS